MNQRKKLHGVKRPPTTDAEAQILCNIFALPCMNLAELNKNYQFTEDNKTMNANESFELLAAKFNKDTGIVAPGKDIAAAVGSDPKTNPTYRQGAWDVWNMLQANTQTKP